MSTLKVDNIRHNNATSDAITMASDGTCTAKLTSIGGGGLSHRNIIINGAMNVAQRGVSSTTNVYQTVDRMACVFGNVDENPTQEQVDVASGTTPYTLGFRKAFKVTNGDQINGLGTNDIIEAIRYRVEAQDMATCGWNYTDPNSFITLSFWVKSSVSFNMKGYFYHHDSVNNSGVTQSYPLETGTLIADTWTKIVRKIPGNSNVAFNMSNAVGLTISFGVFGSLFSSANPPVNQWITYSSATLTNPSETTWYTTNDATLEFTGLQLEVGDTVTSFEHRNHGEELARCQRYCYVIPYGGNSLNTRFIDNIYGDVKNSSEIQALVTFPVPMRDTPTYTGSSTNIELFANNGSDYFTADGFSNYLTYGGENCQSMSLRKSGASSISVGQSGKFLWRATGGFMKFDAEL